MAAEVKYFIKLLKYFLSKIIILQRPVLAYKDPFTLSHSFNYRHFPLGKQQKHYSPLTFSSSNFKLL
jgi:hypothetical protein